MVSEDCDDLLAALIKRACAYKAEVQKLHDKALAAAAAGQQAAPSQKPVIDWQSPPWRCEQAAAGRIQYHVYSPEQCCVTNVDGHACVHWSGRSPTLCW